MAEIVRALSVGRVTVTRRVANDPVSDMVW